MPELNVVINGKTTATYRLTTETVTIGRDTENTIILLDKATSSAHAHISAGPDGWQIADPEDRANSYAGPSDQLDFAL